MIRHQVEPPQRSELGRVDANVASGGAYQVGELEVPVGHNRWRVAVAADAGVSAGDVAIDLVIADPSAPTQRRSSQVATVAYSATGGSATGAVAPVGEAWVRARVSGYVGGVGLYLRLFLETWAEG